MKPALRAHVYAEDPDVPADHHGHGRCRCGLPPAHPAHTLPDTHEADAAHRLRTGEKD